MYQAPRSQASIKEFYETITKFMIPLDIVALSSGEFESGTSLIAAYAKNGEVVYGR